MRPMSQSSPFAASPCVNKYLLLQPAPSPHLISIKATFLQPARKFAHGRSLWAYFFEHLDDSTRVKPSLNVNLLDSKTLFKLTVVKHKRFRKMRHNKPNGSCGSKTSVK